MSDRKSIVIRIDETHHSSTSVRLQGDLLSPHKSARGVKMLSMKTFTRTLDRQFCDQLTPELMRELCEAVGLVLRNWYQDVELPLG